MAWDRLGDGHRLPPRRRLPDARPRGLELSDLCAPHRQRGELHADDHLARALVDDELEGLAALARGADLGAILATGGAATRTRTPTWPSADDMPQHETTTSAFKSATTRASAAGATSLCVARARALQPHDDLSGKKGVRSIIVKGLVLMENRESEDTRRIEGSPRPPLRRTMADEVVQTPLRNNRSGHTTAVRCINGHARRTCQPTTQHPHSHPEKTAHHGRMR